MTLIYLHACVFFFSALVWVPAGYWLRSAAARRAAPQVAREVNALLDDVNAELDAVHGNETTMPVRGGAL